MIDTERERSEFERVVRNLFVSSEFSFIRAPDGYINAVGSRARVDLREYAPVSMMWSLWQAARAEAVQSERRRCEDAVEAVMTAAEALCKVWPYTGLSDAARSKLRALVEALARGAR